MRYKPALFLIIFFIITVSVSAQYYNTGQDPASLKWLQIKTERFKVIYPEKYGAEGIVFARELDKAYSDLTQLFPEKKFKIPVIIHNFTTQSNGYVAWAPKRMEIYPTPEQNSIPLGPVKQLTLHEITHVMQLESLNTGFIKVLSYVMGQQVSGAAIVMFPLWYIEGNAVFSETYLSESGRGRAPDFQKQLKAIVVEKGALYKYDKMISGSFRNFTPDYYQFGYQMVTWSFLINNLQLWNKALSFTANEPFTINPVNISLRENAGLTKKSLFIQTFDSLKTLWNRDIERSKAVPYTHVNPSKKGKYINYYSPLFAGADSIIAIKTSLSDPPAFVLIRISDRSEKKIHIPGNIYPYFISYGNGKIVWVETQNDPRWKNRNYSVIKVKNIRTGRTRQITCRTRLMSATVSPDGKTIAASENSVENVNTLVFIDASNGKVLQRFPAPDNASLQRSQWSANGTKISVIYLTDAGEGIMSFSCGDNSWRILLEAGRNDLQSTYLKDDSLFFVTSATGTENIMLRTGGNQYKITNSRFGATDLNLNDTSVIFSDYTSSGNEICITPIRDISMIDNNPQGTASFLIDRFVNNNPENQQTPDVQYSPEPYRKWQHLLGVHSWMPFYTDIEAIQSNPASIRPGFTLMSQNQLSTLEASIGYEYSVDKQHMFHSRLTWQGWYPVIESRLDYGFRPSIDSYGSPVDSVPSQLSGGYYRFANRIYIPLNFSSGKFSQTFYPSFSTDYINRYVYVKENNSYDVGQIQMTGRLYFANYHRSSFRDIYPRSAQVLDISYAFSPFDKLIYGTDLALKTAFYLPGIFVNNGIKIRYEKEKQEFAKYLAGNKISFPRSYNNIVSKKLDFFSVDYTAPLLYPDFNIGSLLYVKRFRAGIFYDYARGYGNYYLKTQNGSLVSDKYVEGPEAFRSFGINLMSDFYLFRIPFMISGGIEAAWKDFSQNPSIEFKINMDIYGFSIGKMLR
jgi:hypothetical protein